MGLDSRDNGWVIEPRQRQRGVGQAVLTSILGTGKADPTGKLTAKPHPGPSNDKWSKGEGTRSRDRSAVEGTGWVREQGYLSTGGWSRKSAGNTEKYKTALRDQKEKTCRLKPSELLTYP